MTARAAAEARGMSQKSAYKWSSKLGIKWPEISREERSALTKEGLQKAGRPVRAPAPKRRVNGFGEKRDDALALPPEQERQGGTFWMVNNKTGERVLKHSATMIYRHAQIEGWTDWDWGKVE